MAEIQKHYLNANGDHFVAVFATQAKADAYSPPAGAISVPARPSPYHTWNGLSWDEGSAPAPSIEQVEAERERRIALPLDVTLSVGTITVNMEPTAQRDIQGLSTVGLYLTMAQQSTTTSFRDYSNTERDLTPADLVSLGLQAAARIQAVYQASWALKAMSPIPSDYTDDQYWP